MSPTVVAGLSLLAMLGLIWAGMHVAVVLAVVSFVGVWLIRGDPSVAANLLAQASQDAIASHIFGVVPLFVLTGFLVALVSGRYIDRYGARRVLVVAAVAGIAGFVMLAVAHDRPWQVVVAGVLANAYISLGYGALPALVVSEVDMASATMVRCAGAIVTATGRGQNNVLVTVSVNRDQGTEVIPVR